jgi:integrative and conjugative element protein (TIGR02256 family)
LSKPFARLLSNTPAKDPKVVAVGAGTLGSPVILTLARQGFGNWTIIDEDHLLPHNMPRHALSFENVGSNKAEALAYEICGLMNNAEAAQPIPRDVFSVLAEPKQEATFRSADLILDLSASHAVTRELASRDYLSPRMCAFLGPEARFSIVLWEGQEQSSRVDDLEVQLKAAITESKSLHAVFQHSNEAISYAGSCRDASAQLAQDVVAVHAATIASFIKTTCFSLTPGIHLWEWSAETLTLAHHQPKVHGVVIVEQNCWTVRISAHAADQMRYHRRRRLPCETGGVLLGAIDHQRQVVYVGTILPSPPDSAEWTTTYIRGVEGLRKKVDDLSRIAGGDLVYVGEWHSHPAGSSGSPSADDLQAHQAVAEEMGKAGSPGLVLIQGEEWEPHILVSLVD